MASRVLIVSFSVCPAPDRHGVGLLNVIKALASRHGCDVLTLRPAQGELPFVERFMKTRMLRVPVGHGSLGEQVEAFRRAIRRQLEGEEYDIIHLRSAWGGRAVFSGVQAPTRVVYEVARSTEGEPRAADDLLAASLGEEEQLCLERADLVIVPTATARASLIARGLDEARVVAIPPGVDVDHFDFEAEPGDPTPRVLYAGQIAGGRGVRLLASAVGLLHHTHPVRLVLAGAVEEGFRPLLGDALLHAGLVGDDVELLGAIDHDDMPRVIAQATVCVAPASPDASYRPLAGFPTKLLEYMACKRTVVAPRQPSVREVVDDQRDGLLFEPGDAEDLAHQIVRLLDDAPLRTALADSGYRRVRAEFPASATRRRLLDAYAHLLPPSQWVPPSRAQSSLDAFPAHPDTTARRLSPLMGGEVSGEIIVDETTSPHLIVQEPEVEIYMEAEDWESAGEKKDATIEPFGVTDEHTPMLPPDAAVEIGERSASFDLEDEKTIPGVLPQRGTSR